MEFFATEIAHSLASALEKSFLSFSPFYFMLLPVFSLVHESTFSLIFFSFSFAVPRVVTLAPWMTSTLPSRPLCSPPPYLPQAGSYHPAVAA